MTWSLSRKTSLHPSDFLRCPHIPHRRRKANRISDIRPESIERQIVRFAPEFRDCILSRCVSTPKDLESWNSNLVGGDILGGAMNVRQLLFRPTRSLYRTSRSDSIFAEHQRPQVAAFMECVDFMQPRWPSRISTFNSIFCRSFRFGTRESVGEYRTRLWLRKT